MLIDKNKFEDNTSPPRNFLFLEIRTQHILQIKRKKYVLTQLYFAAITTPCLTIEIKANYFVNVTTQKS
jgi:hypothetical protein